MGKRPIIFPFYRRKLSGWAQMTWQDQGELQFPYLKVGWEAMPLSWPDAEDISTGQWKTLFYTEASWLLSAYVHFTQLNTYYFASVFLFFKLFLYFLLPLYMSISGHIWSKFRHFGLHAQSTISSKLTSLIWFEMQLHVLEYNLSLTWW